MVDFKKGQDGAASNLPKIKIAQISELAQGATHNPGNASPSQAIADLMAKLQHQSKVQDALPDIDPKFKTALAQAGDITANWKVDAKPGENAPPRDAGKGPGGRSGGGTYLG